MAHNGPASPTSPTSPRMKGKMDKMLKTVGKKDFCRKHADDVCKTYCEDCEHLICQECIHEDHQGHKIIPSRVLAEELKGDLKACKPEIKRRLLDAKAFFEEAKRNIANVDKKQRAEMEELKKKHAAERNALKKTEIETSKEAIAWQSLINKVTDVTTTLDAVSLAGLKPEVEDALKSGPPGTISEKQTLLQPVIEKVLEEVKDDWTDGDIAIIPEILGAVKRFTEGRTRTLRSHVCPSPNHAYQKLKFLSPDSGSDLLSLLNIKQPITAGKVGPNNNNSILTTGSRSVHAYTTLYNKHDEQSSSVWIPMSLPFSEVIRKATGNSPARITGHNSEGEVELNHTVEHWLKVSATDCFDYWPQE